MGKPGVMLGLPERHEAVTSTPVLDLCAKVLAAISVPGVTLGLILAAGYAADGRRRCQWPRSSRWCSR